MPDEELVRVTTPLGYEAVLRRQNWERHLSGRPEIRDQLTNVGATLSDPDFVIEDLSRRHHFFRYGFGEGATEKCYLISSSDGSISRSRGRGQS